MGRQIISGSKYRANGQLILSRITDPDMIQKAQNIADVWLPDDCCVMDLALVDGKNNNNELKVIEFNCINSSGFYDHDLNAIFTALYDYHVK